LICLSRSVLEFIKLVNNLSWYDLCLLESVWKSESPATKGLSVVVVLGATILKSGLVLRWNSEYSDSKGLSLLKPNLRLVTIRLPGLHSGCGYHSELDRTVFTCDSLTEVKSLLRGTRCWRVNFLLLVCRFFCLSATYQIASRLLKFPV